jgi:hypothetical protein
LDLVLTIVFSIGAVLAGGGALAVALVPVPAWRPLGLLAVAAGSALALLGLSAWVAAAVALACLLASGLLAAGATERAGQTETGRLTQTQVGALAGALLVIVLLVIAVAGGLTGAFASGGSASLDPTALGRALFDRDALAVVAVGAAILVGLAGGAVVRRRRS